MHPIKLIIKKPKQTKGDWAFYREIDKVMIDEESPIKTEAQFCHFMYKKYGEGRYQVLAFRKGVRGFWLFWLGNLYSNGFVRDLGKNKYMDQLQKEHLAAENFERKSEIEEQMQYERELYEAYKIMRGYGVSDQDLFA